MAGIDVLDYSAHRRAQLSQLCHKSLGAGQGRLGGDQADQHLTGGPAVAYQHVADQTGAPVLVEGFITAGGRGSAHRCNGLIQSGVVQQALLHRDHPVGTLGVDTALQAASRSGTEGGHCFVPVVPGVLHAQNGLYRAELAQQLFHSLLLLGQLLRVGQSKQRAAAAALFAAGTGVFHGINSPRSTWLRRWPARSSGRAERPHPAQCPSHRCRSS